MMLGGLLLLLLPPSLPHPAQPTLYTSPPLEPPYAFLLPNATHHNATHNSATRHLYTSLPLEPPYAVLLPNAKYNNATHHNVRRHKRQAEQYGGMRIRVFYDSSLAGLGGAEEAVVREKAVPAAVEYWQQALQVLNPVEMIRLNRKCKDNQYFLEPGESTQFCKEECVETRCGEVVVPRDHLEGCHTCDSTGRQCGQYSQPGTGVHGVDFVLYVSTLSTSQCHETVGGKAETVSRI